MLKKVLLSSLSSISLLSGCSSKSTENQYTNSTVDGVTFKVIEASTAESAFGGALENGKLKEANSKRVVIKLQFKNTLNKETEVDVDNFSLLNTNIKKKLLLRRTIKIDFILMKILILPLK